MRVFIIERNEEMDAYDAVTNESGSESALFRRIEAIRIRAYASFTLAGASIAKSLWECLHAVSVSPQARPSGFRDL